MFAWSAVGGVAGTLKGAGKPLNKRICKPWEHLIDK